MHFYQIHLSSTVTGASVSIHTRAPHDNGLSGEYMTLEGPFYTHCVTIGVTARGLARYNRVSLACLLILSYNVHIDVYTFFHSICPMSMITSRI